MDNLKNKVKELIEDMLDYEKIELYNNYASINSYEMILDNNIDEILEGKSPSEVYNSLDNNYNFNDDYVIYNGYGYLESFDGCQIDDYIDIDDIINFIVDNQNNLDNDDIQELFEELEEEEDEEIEEE